MFRRKSNYEKSQSVVTVHFKPSTSTREAVEEIFNYKKTNNRQILSSKLIALLDAEAGIEASKVKISDTNQYHKKRNGRTVFKQYGYYRPQSNYIYIQNRTAVRGQHLAPKTFIDTLLHEWLHHYDHKRLKLNSIHTTGFFLRLKDLKTKLDIV